MGVQFSRKKKTASVFSGRPLQLGVILSQPSSQTKGKSCYQMEGQNDNIFLPVKVSFHHYLACIPKKKVPALLEQELSIFFLMDLFTL